MTRNTRHSWHTNRTIRQVRPHAAEIDAVRATVVPSLRRRDVLSAERQDYSRCADPRSADNVHFHRAKYLTVPRGVTLVEVLVATMLSVVLLTAIGGILRSMQTQRKALAGDTGEAEWRRSLVDQLTWDILNSRRIHVRANRVRLIGYAGRDPETGMPEHRPTEVVYQVVSEAGQSWLIREETRLDDRTNHNWTRELVAHDVGSIKLFRVDGTGDEHDLEAGAAAQPDPFTIPGHVRFVFTHPDGRELISGRAARMW